MPLIPMARFTAAPVMTTFASIGSRPWGGCRQYIQETSVTVTSSKSETVERKAAPAEAAPERKKTGVHPSLRALPDYPQR